MEESSITCAKFINADIALVICAPERGAVSPNFPHLLSPDQQGDSSCPYRPCGVLCQSLMKGPASIPGMAPVRSLPRPAGKRNSFFGGRRPFSIWQDHAVTGNAITSALFVGTGEKVTRCA